MQLLLAALNTVSTGQIRRAVTQVLADAQYRRQAQQLSEEFRSYPTNELTTGYIYELA